MRLARRLLASFALAASLSAPAWAGQELAALPSSGRAIFGSSEVFSANNSAFYKWTGMVRRFAAERQAVRGLCAPGVWESCEPMEWRALVNELKGLDLRGKLERTNEAVNRYPYIPSQANWGEGNHWETPFEFFRKSGQCQDYAITKYMLLREAGVPASDLRLVVLRDTSLALDHAVIVAFVDGEAVLLDNQIRGIVPVASVHHYQPYYSINEQGWWLHRGLNARYAANNR